MTQSTEAIALQVTTGPVQLTLQLHHCLDSCTDGPAVLLLHGGNTDSDTFRYPSGGLVRYLRKKFDVWLLDWRGSPRITDPYIDARPDISLLDERQHYNLDIVSAHDIPMALTEIRKAIGAKRKLSLLAHCLSGPAVCLAISRGTLKPFNLDHVVLMTLGLFCEVPWNGWLKAENFILERVIGDAHAECRGISPRRPEAWPDEMSRAYAIWPKPWLPTGDAFLERLSFLIGQPFARARLHPELLEVGYEKFFGHLHLGLYMHAAQIVRRGYVAAFDAPDVVDRSRVRRREGAKARALRDLDAQHFRELDVTLVTALQNQVWHRDSMDLMYEWLRNQGCHRVNKAVFAGYNLQELLWGRDAHKDVYPTLHRALGLEPD
jgi:pimeloyl-ACP methyl ester carboxylesterase